MPLDVPPLGARRATGDGEAQAHAATAHRRAPALERLEEPLPVGSLDPRATVLHVEVEEAGTAGELQLHRLVARRVAKGVLEQIDQCSQRLNEVEPPDLDGVARRERHTDCGRPGQRAHPVERRTDEVLGGVERGLGGEGAGADSRQVEEIGHEAVEALGLLLDDRGALVPVGAQFRCGRPDGRERRAQVVRHVGQHGVLEAVGLAERLHVPRLVPQPLDLPRTLLCQRHGPLCAVQELGRHRPRDEERQEHPPFQPVGDVERVERREEEEVEEQEAEHSGGETHQAPFPGAGAEHDQQVGEGHLGLRQPIPIRPQGERGHGGQCRPQHEAHQGPEGDTCPTLSHGSRSGSPRPAR